METKEVITCRNCDFFHPNSRETDENTNYLGKCTHPQTHPKRQLRYANHFCGYAKKDNR